MSNFKVYLEKAQGNIVNIDISDFINENFSRYLKNITVFNEDNYAEVRRLIKQGKNKLDLIFAPQEMKMKINFEGFKKDILIDNSVSFDSFSYKDNNKSKEFKEFKGNISSFSELIKNKNISTTSVNDNARCIIKPSSLIPIIEEYFELTIPLPYPPNIEDE